MMTRSLRLLLNRMVFLFQTRSALCSATRHIASFVGVAQAAFTEHYTAKAKLKHRIMLQSHKKYRRYRHGSNAVLQPRQWRVCPLEWNIIFSRQHCHLVVCRIYPNVLYFASRLPPLWEVFNTPHTLLGNRYYSHSLCNITKKSSVLFSTNWPFVQSAHLFPTKGCHELVPHSGVCGSPALPLWQALAASLPKHSPHIRRGHGCLKTCVSNCPPEFQGRWMCVPGTRPPGGVTMASAKPLQPTRQSARAFQSSTPLQCCFKGRRLIIFGDISKAFSVDYCILRTIRHS